jgi:single-stranded-DNA-specific exonuclease
MNELPDVFLQFGGHKMAAGFSLHEGAVHTLEEKLSEAFEKTAQKAEIEEVLLDARLKLSDVVWETANMIDKVSPFGIGNEKPLFVFENTEIISMKLFGKQKNHLSISVKDTSTGRSVDAIAFFSDCNSFDVQIKTGSLVNIVGSIEKSYFRGRPELRLRLVDIIDQKF